MAFLRLCASTCLCLVVTGCAAHDSTTESAWTPVPAPDLGPVVARVGDVPIFAQQVKARAAHSGLSAQQALQELVDLHALAEDARSLMPLQLQGAELRSVIVQRFLEREFETSARPEDVPEPELRRLYEAAKDKFVHPRFREIAVLSLAVGPNAGVAERQRLAGLARELVARASATADRAPESFLAISTDPTWKARGVRASRIVQGPDRPLSARVGQAATQLKAPGDTSGIIEDDSGFYVVRYISETAAAQVSFEQARDELRANYYPHWRTQRFLEFTTKKTEAHRVEIHPGRLGS